MSEIEAARERIAGLERAMLAAPEAIEDLRPVRERALRALAQAEVAEAEQRARAAREGAWLALRKPAPQAVEQALAKEARAAG